MPFESCAEMINPEPTTHDVADWEVLARIRTVEYTVLVPATAAAELLRASMTSSRICASNSSEISLQAI